MNALIQQDFFRPKLERSPVLVAYGAGVDSTAMVIEMISRGDPIDQVLMAQTNSERQQTDDYAEMFAQWVRSKGIPFEFVAYQAKNFKQWPIYQGLYENCLVNGTLPSISLGFNSCSAKTKIAPQDKWARNWEIANTAWAQGLKVTKVIGYDCSPADIKRYAEREGYVSEQYDFRYPLREWQWRREDCIARIKAEGLPVPIKSACFMCLATKPHEVDEYSPEILRRIVLLEARAHPRVKTVQGLWRHPIKGMRGATPRPGSMTEYIRDKNLLDAKEIDFVWNEGPPSYLSWQGSVAQIAVQDRPKVAQWLHHFDKREILLKHDAQSICFDAMMGDKT